MSSRCPERGWIVHALALPLLIGAAACRRGSDAGDHPATVSGGQALVLTSAFQAGGVARRVTSRNPYEGDARALADGGRLYAWFNCTGCHGPEGGGGMGPPFRDRDWIYGNDPASIYQSIGQGRPNGMPAFGAGLPDDELWKLALYVRSLGERGSAP